MQPCLNPANDVNDYVFLSRFSVRNLDVERGDIVSLVSPKNPEQKLIKRIVGLQGDFINTLGYKKSNVIVPEGHCWIEGKSSYSLLDCRTEIFEILGDHTGNSLDSNHFGPVSLGLITAKATYIIWPPSRFQKLESKLPKARLQSLSIKPLTVTGES